MNNKPTEEEIELRGYYCPHCRDTHMEFPDCETCGGKGWVDDPSDGGYMNCPECDNEECATCKGGVVDPYDKEGAVA